MSPLKRNNYKIDDETLKAAVAASISIAEVFRKLDICNTGTAYKTLKRRIANLQLDTSHFKGQGYLKNRSHSWAPKLALEKILIENSPYVSTISLKNRLLKEQVLENKCCKCGILSIWNGEPLSLQLDHINGISNDNRIENLRILCPNCHSQTNTFAGRNKRRGANEGS